MQSTLIRIGKAKVANHASVIPHHIEKDMGIKEGIQGQT